ncbi:hypothetical protein MML48_9g00002312 [Holotrichia oblita]|uniref:Uncharacterized protein n=1 Tax=Holotrichia oblita TaxID=644536 RepID=A0ACB9SK23_HOLOL|nr:hypothetical protein MML48_9g00002312 [Holotrichia oblita]
MVDTGFIKAQSDNLPRVDVLMLTNFFHNNLCFMSSEMRGVKTQIASREQYGDAAVGYVQLKREQSLCILKCKVCPEHKVHAKQYNVELVINEETEFIERAECLDCAASESGCKHAVAFLMWTHRRSEEPACTSVESYWKKSTLSKVASSIRYLKAVEFGTSRKSKSSNKSGKSFFDDVVQELKRKKVNAQIIKHTEEHEILQSQIGSIHTAVMTFSRSGECDFKQFKQFFKKLCNAEVCSKIEQLTRSQYKSELWHEMRYGRVTASKAYDVLHCKTDGSLVELILGAYKVPDTKAIRRGKYLEPKVISKLQQQLSLPLRNCGLTICEKYPFVSATPDAIGKDLVVEIKCPFSEKTMKNYLTTDKKITPRYKAQIQLQMYASKKAKGFFCVADLSFEDNRKINVSEIAFDEVYVAHMLAKIELFWREYIFSKVFSSVNI